jgi:hypothetical protein
MIATQAKKIIVVGFYHTHNYLTARQVCLRYNSREKSPVKESHADRPQCSRKESSSDTQAQSSRKESSRDKEA